jgi:hypothetical protein
MVRYRSHMSLCSTPHSLSPISHLPSPISHLPSLIGNEVRMEYTDCTYFGLASDTTTNHRHRHTYCRLAVNQQHSIFIISNCHQDQSISTGINFCRQHGQFRYVVDAINRFIQSVRNRRNSSRIGIPYAFPVMRTLPPASGLLDNEEQDRMEMDTEDVRFHVSSTERRRRRHRSDEWATATTMTRRVLPPTATAIVPGSTY